MSICSQPCLKIGRFIIALLSLKPKEAHSSCVSPVRARVDVAATGDDVRSGPDVL